MSGRLVDRTDEGAVVEDSKGRKWFAVAHWAEINGRAECIGLELWKGSRPAEKGSYRSLPGQKVTAIGSADLRDIPVATWLRTLWGIQRTKDRQLARTARRAADRAERNIDTWQTATGPSASDRLREYADGVESRRGRRSANDREHFADVAAVYLAAVKERGNPNAAVAERWGVDKSTVTRWANRCEQLGLLPPTTPGSARKGPIKKRKS